MRVARPADRRRPAGCLRRCLAAAICAGETPAQTAGGDAGGPRGAARLYVAGAGAGGGAPGAIAFGSFVYASDFGISFSARTCSRNARDSDAGL